jgi:hypothetical protein
LPCGNAGRRSVASRSVGLGSTCRCAPDRAGRTRAEQGLCGDGLLGLGPLYDSLHTGQSGLALPRHATATSASAAIASAHRRSRHCSQQFLCSHKWRSPTPAIAAMQPCMTGAEADREQRFLMPAAMGAAVRVGVGMGGVDKLDEDEDDVRRRRARPPTARIMVATKRR